MSGSSDKTKTAAGNYFITNYPPFSFWKKDYADEAIQAMQREPRADTPLGIYLHIPFCRKRCHFCYFRVYTDKNAADIQRYLDACIHELELYAKQPFVGGRKPRAIYFGGGTPSYLSVRQLTALTDAMKRLFPWDEAEEITFECEPGTLSEPKIQFLADVGITRISLGVEHFDPEILEINGRAHGAPEIDRVYEMATRIGFPQINIDLIAGMMGETDETWRGAVEKTVAMQPDSVTIYQMEVPYNTTIYKDMKHRGATVAPVADWDTKRAWVASAFEYLEANGYTVNSTCTAVRDPQKTRFVYRRQLFAGADMIGVGVASFGHINGTHYQLEHDWEPYISRLQSGELPVLRALTPSADERLIREVVLQFKLGSVQPADFQKKFDVDIRERFREQLAAIDRQGFLEDDDTTLRLTRDGLLQVDRLMLDFFLPEHSNARYA